MTANEYKSALKRLGLGVSTLETQGILGLGPRQLLRYVHEASEIPEPVAKLLFMLERHGIPPEWRR